MTQLDGVVSRKTLLGLLPFVEEPAEEFEELDKERAEENADFYVAEKADEERQVLA